MSEYLKDAVLEKLMQYEKDDTVIYEDEKRKVYKGGIYKEKIGELKNEL